MNRDVYDSLPKEMQAKIKQIFDRYLDETMEWVHQKDEEYKKIMLKERPHMSFSDFSNAQLKPFAEKAKPVYPQFGKLGGDGAQEILEALLNDIEKAKAKYGDKICLMGNIDSGATLCWGTEADVHQEVKECIRKAGKGGGLICTSSNSVHSGVKPENYVAMVKAIREYGQYPLSL